MPPCLTDASLGNWGVRTAFLNVLDFAVVMKEGEEMVISNLIFFQVVSFLF